VEVKQQYQDKTSNRSTDLKNLHDKTSIVLGKVSEKISIFSLKGRRWVDNIKMDLREIGWDWIDLAQDRDQWRALVKAVMNLRVP
jgi:hypothetical protein